ncbi:MAG: protein kinase domain-containing protein [Terriglobales bacterium]
MPLETGSKLGPYEITGAVGAGGMGEVYRARDTRLGRDVAIKVLPEAFAKDAILKERFEREAKTISSLNHPNICTLYDLGHQNGTDFLVMELLEGDSLAQRLAKGALPVAETLRIGAEMADALERAHRQGIVHRDLKPGNIVLTKSGAKLLDFGLAKPQGLATGSSFSGIATQVSPTSPVTREGTVIGTFQYMSPEQVEGREADARSDIFALGAVLYEMATGRRAFEGKSQISVASAILEKEPEPVSRVQPMTPPALEHVVKTCLAKDPEERFQTAHDVRLQLKWISESGSQVSALPVVRRKHSRERVAWTVAGIMALAAVALGVSYVRQASRPESGVVKRFVVTLPSSAVLFAGLTNSLAVSPDGQYFVYRASQASGGWRLYLHSISELEPTPISGSEDALNPFFSPDGKWVAFFAGGKLKRVAVSGGAPLTICDAPDGRGASWGPDDTIVFGGPGNTGLRRVSAKGGKAEELTRVDASQKEVSHRWPEFLPGGKEVLFSIQGLSADWDVARIAVLSLKTGKWRTLIEGGTNPHYSPTGHLIYARTGMLVAVPFDLDRLEVTGSPVPLVEDVFMNRVSGNAEAAFSPEGTLLYMAGRGTDEPRELVWVDRKGTAQSVGVAPGAFEQPSLSPDGRKVALHIQPPSDDVWEYDLGRGTLTRLTFQPGEDEAPLWSPDGKHVAYSATISNEPRAILWKNADGSGKEEVLATTGFHIHLSSFSPDGRLLAYTNYESETRGDIWLLPLTGDRKPRPFLQTPFNERDAKISPDGRWIAYTSDETGRDEVYVQALEGAGGKYQVSSQGGFGALWARSGRELFYRNDNKVMAVAVTTHPGFSASSPRLLFEGLYEIHPRREGIWDVAPDGQRFLMAKAVGRETQAIQLRVVLNFFSDIRRRTREGDGK